MNCLNWSPRRYAYFWWSPDRAATRLRQYPGSRAQETLRAPGAVPDFVYFRFFGERLTLSCCRGSDLPFDALRIFDLGNSQVVCGLQIQPRARIATEVARKPHGSISTDTAPLAYDVVDARRRHVQGLRQRISAHPERNHKILSQYFAGMNRPHAVLDHHTSPSVVVDDLDVLRTTRRPTKTQAELIVHADGVLACSPALQGLKPITQWRAQEFQGVRGIELR